MVQKAFDMLDSRKDGQITIEDIIAKYDVTKNPEFIKGKKSREQILSEFLNQFEGAKGNRNGIISKQEFFDYYTDLAMSTPSDEYFVKMMESVWCISENEEDSIFVDRVRELVSMMRQRLLSISNNS
jgi:Ca2+-binding EF-hand superfamily protein